MAAQPQMFPGGHLTASPSPQAAALAAVQSPTPATSSAATSAPSVAPTLVSMATSLPQVAGATAAGLYFIIIISTSDVLYC